MKRCSKCGNTKATVDFYQSTKAKDGLTHWCKECMRESARAHGRKNSGRKRDQLRQWRAENPEKGAEYRKRHREKYGHDHFVARERERTLLKYGMSVDDFDRLLASQGGGCAICKSTERVHVVRGEDRLRKLSVDHDHTTGVVRGILCNVCNRAVGLLQDDPALLAEALAYLTRKPSDL